MLNLFREWENKRLYIGSCEWRIESNENRGNTLTVTILYFLEIIINQSNPFLTICT